MKKIIFILLFILPINIFSFDLKAKYISIRASKTFEIIKYYTDYHLDRELNGIIFSKEINKNDLKKYPNHYKAIFDENDRLIRLEEIKQNQLFGFFLYNYDNEKLIPEKIQYHYIGFNRSNKSQFFISILSKPELDVYFIEYYKNGKLVKRETYKNQGLLIKEEYFLFKKSNATKENK